MNSDEKIRNFLGITKLELKNEDGVSETFIVKSIKTRDLGKIIGALGEIKPDAKPEDMTSDELANLMNAISEVATDMLSRTFEGLSEDEIDNLILKNYDSISNCVMSQIGNIGGNDANRIKELQKTIKKGKKK